MAAPGACYRPNLGRSCIFSASTRKWSSCFLAPSNQLHTHPSLAVTARRSIVAWFGASLYVTVTSCGNDLRFAHNLYSL